MYLVAQEPIEIEDESEDGQDQNVSTIMTPPRSPIKTMTLQRKASIVEDLPYDSLSQDPLLLNVDVCPWRPANAPAPYSFLAHALDELSRTRSRIAILNILTNALCIIIQHDPDAILSAMYLLSNSLSPPYLPIELGLGGSIITKAIQHVSGLTGPALRRLHNRTGDPGDVAFEAKSAIRTLIPHPSLTISWVFRTMHSIANAKGQGSVKQKQTLVEKLLLSAKGEETRYIVRTLCQHIRVGATRTTVLSAISRALVLSPPRSAIQLYSGSPLYASPDLLSKIGRPSTNGKKKKDAGADPARVTILEMFNEAEGIVKRTFVQRPNFEDLVSAVMEGAIESLQDRAPLTVGEWVRNYVLPEFLGRSCSYFN
jgi:DNA ligase-1